ncbi:MAG: TerB family tellurite resistance protein [Halioglobus sp.]
MSVSRPSYGLVIEGDKLVVTATPRNMFFDPRFLIAALLEHVARGDGVICDAETRSMIDLVAEHFDLDKSRAEQKFTHALALYSRTMDLAKVGAVLSEILPSTERQEVLVMLLQVIAADGRQGSDELEALDEVVAVLSITQDEKHAAFSQYFELKQSNSSVRRMHIG